MARAQVRGTWERPEKEKVEPRTILDLSPERPPVQTKTAEKEEETSRRLARGPERKA